MKGIRLFVKKAVEWDEVKRGGSSRGRGGGFRGGRGGRGRDDDFYERRGGTNECLFISI